MYFLYYTFLYQPLLNALIVLYNSVSFGDLGIAIILLTIAIRLILFPVFHKSVRHQAVMQRLQPELKKIQEKHSGDREQQAKAMMGLYRENKINPFSGILLLFLQLPVLIALYHVFSGIAAPEAITEGIYSFVHAPAILSATLLGLINLGERSIVMVCFAAAAQYLQGKLALPKRKDGEKLSDAERISRNMVFIAPILTLVIFWGFPAAISLYWLTSSLFSVVQQLIVNKEFSHS
ncbi:MAG: YidC/Oxa1 family membrane protein insertase [Patescibacteria group bacterium]|nr:YidC/Oxa1 family membrane protein insertase [Patescibacteria group bacterium]